MQLLFAGCPQCGVTMAWRVQPEAAGCPCCFGKPDELLWRNMLETNSDNTLFLPARLEAILEGLDLVHYEDVSMTAAAAEAVQQPAAKLLNEEHLMQAKLLQAHADMRLGRMEAAGLSIRQIHAWAVEHSDSAMLARTYRQLSGFFFRLGDASSAMEHAMQAQAYLPEDSHPILRSKTLMALALALDLSGDQEDAIRRYEEILDLSRHTLYIQQHMYALNNLAYLHYDIGQYEEASRQVEALRQVAHKHGVPLAISQLETVSRIEIVRGNPKLGIRTLEPMIKAHRAGRTIGESYYLPECMLTLAEAWRETGNHKEAQSLLQEARLICETMGYKGTLVRILQEQARQYALLGMYKEAYEEHVLYHKESEELRSSEREARARILHAVFEVEAARRSSETYREQAHRDPLTGLYNRRFIDRHLDAVLCLGSEYAEVTAVLLDLDYFKRINDTLSHQAGDAVLVQLAKLLTAAAVEPVKAARLGGEEFLLLCPGYDFAKGMVFANRLCEMIRLTDWSPIAGSLSVTASIGVAAGCPGEVDGTNLLALADEQLYRAKRAGRNQVAGADEDRRRAMHGA